MIYWIDGDFWIWKTSLAVHIALSMWYKLRKYWITRYDTIIFSNIILDIKKFPNYVYFPDHLFLDTLRYINLINDIERQIYTKKRKSWFEYLDRNKFTKFLLFFDESGSLMNNRIKLNNQNIYNEYINQNRKNFMDLYLISAEWNENMKFLRGKVDWWYTIHNYSRLPILNDFWIIKKEKRDIDGKIITTSYISKDDRWDFILKEKPIIESCWFFYKPFVWLYYNDLHKNITDIEKYDIRNIWFNLNSIFLDEKNKDLNLFLKKNI